MADTANREAFAGQLDLLLVINWVATEAKTEYLFFIRRVWQTSTVGTFSLRSTRIGG